jgi:magnesium transporter
MLKYNKQSKNIERVESFTLPTTDEIIWFHIENKSYPKTLDTITEKLKVHPLALRFMEEFSDLPKVNIFKNEAVISVFSIEEDFQPVKINILVGTNFIITREQDSNLRLLSEIIKHFEENPEHMSHTGYILYRIIDKVSIEFLRAVDEIADEIQALEKSVFKDPFENKIGKNAYRWKARLHDLRQIIEPQEDVIKSIGQSEFPYINEDSGFYFQDLQHNYVRIISAFDTFIENMASIFNLQLSLKSDHTNTIMKTLTLVSVIFIPMTFIAGLYGMNFDYMPELKWDYGYLYVLLLIFGLGIGISLYFRNKGWWGKKGKSEKTK